MLTPEFETDIRGRVNPLYVNQRGTESYERAALLGEIDRLRQGERFVLRYCAEQEQEIKRLISAIKQTLDDNGHLADGENCTLIELKRAIGDE